MPVNNPLERILREIRRRTRVVGAFPDGQSALNLAAARLRHVAGTEWSTKRYLSMDLLKVTSRRSSPPEPQPGAAQPNQMCERNWTPPQVDPQFERVAAARLLDWPRAAMTLSVSTPGRRLKGCVARQSTST